MGPLNILTKAFKKESPQTSNHLSLTLTSDKILTCIWAFNQDQVEILGHGQKKFTNIDSLIHQAAIAIDAAGEQAKSDISKTVFGLSQNWFENGELSIETNKILKNLSSDLELDPQAFVSLSAAINHLLKIEESVTPNAVLVGIFTDCCEVHLLKNNKVVSTYTFDSQPTIGKIVQLIGQLKSESEDLPARVIIYGLDEKSEIVEEIVKVDWKDLFIHEPKIDILEDEELVKATAYTQAADILGHEPVVGDAIKAPEKVESAANEFGFIEGQDIIKTAKSPTPGETKATASEDYAVDLVSQSSLKPVTEKVHHQSPVENLDETDYDDKKSLGEEIVTVSWLPKILGLFKRRPQGKKLLILSAILVVLILAGVYVASQTLSRAEVVIKVNSKQQDSNFNANVVAGGSYDLAKSQIPGQEVIGIAQGNQKAVTTGNKKLGDKAKGEVTVFNWTTSPKNFPGQTLIISKNGLKFTLDSDIEVASRSASTPGQSKTAVAAVDFGPSGNLEAGNDFTFQEFDELLYSARNDSAFTGGAEREVTIVSKEDLERLEKSLSETLTEKAKEDLRGKAGSLTLNDQTVIVKVDKKEFDKKLDDEASLLNLNMEIKATAIVYDEMGLKNFLSESTKEEIPQEFEARADNIELTDINVKRKNDTLTLSGKYRANLTPKFDEENLKDKIAGQDTKKARAIIKEIPEVSDVFFNFFPNLPLISSIPRNKSKITFKLETS